MCGRTVTRFVATKAPSRRSAVAEHEGDTKGRQERTQRDETRWGRPAGGDRHHAVGVSFDGDLDIIQAHAQPPRGTHHLSVALRLREVYPPLAGFPGELFLAIS